MWRQSVAVVALSDDICNACHIRIRSHNHSFTHSQSFIHNHSQSFTNIHNHSQSFTSMIMRSVSAVVRLPEDSCSAVNDDPSAYASLSCPAPCFCKPSGHVLLAICPPPPSSETVLEKTAALPPTFTIHVVHCSGCCISHHGPCSAPGLVSFTSSTLEPRCYGRAPNGVHPRAERI